MSLDDEILCRTDVPRWVFELDNFEPLPSEELVCSICRGVFYDPVKCPCNHVFCRPCITPWLSSNSNCPVCRKFTLNSCLTQVVPLVNNMIMNLTMHCQYAKSGCKSLIRLRCYMSHVQQCLYEPVMCKNKSCVEIVMRKNLTEHEQKCPFKVIKCQRCNLNISAKKIMRHNCVKRLQGLIKKTRICLQKKTKEIQVLNARLTGLKQIKEVKSFEDYAFIFGDVEHIPYENKFLNECLDNLKREWTSCNREADGNTDENAAGRQESSSSSLALCDFDLTIGDSSASSFDINWSD